MNETHRDALAATHDETHRPGRTGSGIANLVELSHRVQAGMITYPGLPGPTLTEHFSFEQSRSMYAPGTEFMIGNVSLLTSTGTYIDSPRHRFPGGRDVSQISLDRCAMLPTVVVHIEAVEEIGPASVPDDVEGRAVLFRTGWDQHWHTPQYGAEGHPYLTEPTAQRLVDLRVALVGIDAVNVDRTKIRERPAHTTLLAADVPIVENLTNLSMLPAHGALFTAAPILFHDAPSFPVRAFAVVPAGLGAGRPEVQTGGVND